MQFRRGHLLPPRACVYVKGVCAQDDTPDQNPTLHATPNTRVQVRVCVEGKEKGEKERERERERVCVCLYVCETSPPACSQEAVAAGVTTRRQGLTKSPAFSQEAVVAGVKRR